MPPARAVILAVILIAGSLPPPSLHAQPNNGRAPPPEKPALVVLEQHYPDPVNPETWIPFVLSPDLFRDDQEVVVTMRIVNVLNQVITNPEAVDHPSGRGTRIINLVYTEPGRKIAYWDGKDLAGRQVPSSIYYLDLVVGRERLTRKLTVLNNPRRRRTIFPW